MFSFRKEWKMKENESSKPESEEETSSFTLVSDVTFAIIISEVLSITEGIESETFSKIGRDVKFSIIEGRDEEVLSIIIAGIDSETLSNIGRDVTFSITEGMDDVTMFIISGRDVVKLSKVGRDVTLSSTGMIEGRVDRLSKIAGTDVTVSTTDATVIFSTLSIIELMELSIPNRLSIVVTLSVTERLSTVVPLSVVRLSKVVD